MQLPSERVTKRESDRHAMHAFSSFFTYVYFISLFCPLIIDRSSHFYVRS